MLGAVWAGRKRWRDDSGFVPRSPLRPRGGWRAGARGRDGGELVPSCYRVRAGSRADTGRQGLLVAIVRDLPQGAHAEKKMTETIYVRLLIVHVAFVPFLERAEREQE